MLTPMIEENAVEVAVEATEAVALDVEAVVDSEVDEAVEASAEDAAVVAAAVAVEADATTATVRATLPVNALILSVKAVLGVLVDSVGRMVKLMDLVKIEVTTEVEVASTDVSKRNVKYLRPPNKNEIVVAKPFLCLFINVKWKTKFDYYKIISKLSSTNIHRRRRHRCHYVSFASEVKDAKLLK